MHLRDAWGSIRDPLRNGFSFPQMKDVAGAAGLPVYRLANIQSGMGGASKGQLMDAIEQLYAESEPNDQDRVVLALIEEIARRRPELREQLEASLRRVGWGLSGGDVHPLTLQLDLEMSSLSATAQDGLRRSIARYRDGDTAGAIASICGIVDSLTEEAYAEHALGDHRQDSYHARISKAVAASEQAFRSRIADTDVAADELDRIWNNHRKSVSQAGYVLGAFRREFSDVHGVQEAPSEFVQTALDAAVYIVRSLIGVWYDPQS